MNSRNDNSEEKKAPGADIDSEESADIFQTKEEAQKADAEQRDDLLDEDIISLDGSD